MKSWMRVLEVTLTSQVVTNGKARQLKFGTEWQNGKPDLNIRVNGKKYMSTLKDTCTVEISNLSYSEVIKIIEGKFFDIDITCGYRSGSSFKIFSGGILYISNSIDDTKSNTIIILCASKLVARYGQSRINLSVKSGVNMYSAMNLICRKAGIPTSTLSTKLKGQMIQNTFSGSESAANWIDKFTSVSPTLITNADAIAGSIVNVFDAKNTNFRVIKLLSSTIDLSGGYPQLTNDGLTLTVMPTFAFMCGDVIEIDNALISLPTRSIAEVSKNYGYFLDEKGNYMIYEIDFNLENRGSQFSLQLSCKSRSLISGYLGKY